MSRSALFPAPPRAATSRPRRDTCGPAEPRRAEPAAGAGCAPGARRKAHPPRLCSRRVPQAGPAAQSRRSPAAPRSLADRASPSLPAPVAPQPPPTLALPASSFFSRSSSSMASVRGEQSVMGGGRRAHPPQPRHTQLAVLSCPVSQRRQLPWRGRRRRHLHLHVNTRPGKVTWLPAPPPAAIPPLSAQPQPQRPRPGPARPGPCSAQSRRGAPGAAVLHRRIPQFRARPRAPPRASGEGSGAAHPLHTPARGGGLPLAQRTGVGKSLLLGVPLMSEVTLPALCSAAAFCRLAGPPSVTAVLILAVLILLSVFLFLHVAQLHVAWV